VEAFRQTFPDLSVLQLDAHADLRDSYEGTPFNHACAMARVLERSPLVGVGIRSLSPEEAERIRRKKLPIFMAHRMRQDSQWMDSALENLTDTVYLTIDLDALDPSIMPAVGTPEPGGLGWYETLDFLKRVFQRKRVVGMDVVELCPLPEHNAPDFLAARLVYKAIAYHQKFSRLLR